MLITAQININAYFVNKECKNKSFESSLELLSDYYDNSFGKAFGVLMEEWHLLARAVLVLDSQNTVQYTEYLENINESPNYEKPVGVVKSL